MGFTGFGLGLKIVRNHKEIREENEQVIIRKKVWIFFKASRFQFV